MASIGGYTVAVLVLKSGGLAGMGQSLDEITRPGTNGRGYVMRGTKPVEAVYSSISNFASAANRNTAAAGYTALIGSVVTLTRDDSTTATVLVKGVRITREKNAGVVISPMTGTYMLSADWTVEVRA